MHWAFYVIIGAVFNVLINFGYKAMNGKINLFLLTAIESATLSIILFVILAFQKNKAAFVSSPNLLIIPVILGGFCCLNTYFFINAISKGPLTLVNPLWACLFTLFSAALGMLVLKETPSLISLCGVGLYLVGAFLMAKG